MISFFNRSPILLIIIALVLHMLSASALADEASCDGEHMLLLEEHNENITCAILIDDELIFPRNIKARDNQIWLIDKGSNLFVNEKHNGALYRYEKSNDGYQRTQILSDLDDPNDIDIRQHADGEDWVYFTTRDKVQRFKASSPDTELETIIDDLSTHGWHKLVAIHLTQNALYLTVPSTTDHCEIEGLQGLVELPCREEQNGTALMREYSFDGDQLSPDYKVVAQGLRDALAVQISPDNTQLIVADNGWDQVDLRDTGYEYDSTPYDEINIIDLSEEEHFGWPYCFDDGLVVPPYRDFLDSCDEYQTPDILLQAHSAPLNMMYFDNELLINLHGNNQAGGKTAAFEIDEEGLPLGMSGVKINWHYNSSSNSPVIGRPFGLSETLNNELLVTDDWNHQLLKIVFETD